MPELSQLAEWLGYEVIDVEGEHVVRYRQQSGKWEERDQRATAAEILLYDAVRGLVGTANEVHVLARVAGVLLVSPTELTMQVVLEKLAGLLADNRHWREKANGTDEELLACRKEIAELRAGARLGPKGGDRNEFVRQVRRTAHAIVSGKAGPFNEEVVEGAVRFANTVLHLLGEPVFNQAERVELPPEQWEWRQQMAERVKQLKADRWKGHDAGTCAFYRNQGEQNAFDEVVAFLVGEEEL